MEKYIIYDTGINGVGNNAIFNKDVAYRISHTLLPLVHLYENAEKEGVHLITPDVFLSNLDFYKDKNVYLISQLITPDTKKIIDCGIFPLILMCQESPFIATRFYVNLKKYTALFKYSMLFPGMQKMASKKTTFINMFFPQFFSNEAFKKIPFIDKKFMVYIASNKKISGVFKLIVIKLLYGFNISLIYHMRNKLILFFNDQKGFDLYGRGWGKEKDINISKNYKGEVINKEEKLREYKFVLCLENSIFPGYVTEKIFDCFFAGSVPVYLGAKDISEYIPSNTFINIADFKDLNDLRTFLNSIDETKYQEYIKNISSFLESNDYIKYSHQKFTANILHLIKNQ